MTVIVGVCCVYPAFGRGFIVLVAIVGVALRDRGVTPITVTSHFIIFLDFGLSQCILECKPITTPHTTRGTQCKPLLIR
jgi:hypothetical protein